MLMRISENNVACPRLSFVEGNSNNVENTYRLALLIYSSNYVQVFSPVG